MKIVGTDGLDPQTIRDEVERGARFVLFTYCVSLLVVTLKRPSNIYFIRPGQSRMIRGLPFLLISLVAGWWGFPWGPIYTLQSLVTGVLGGKDVTDEILASIAPATVASVVATPAAPSTGSGAPRAAEPSTAKKIAAGIAVVGALAATIVAGICLYQRTHLTVVLVSGAPKPYAVELNGTRHTLAPGRPVILTRSEGDFRLTGGARADAAPQKFRFALPFFDHLFSRRVAVINPDRAAIVVQEAIVYRVEGAPPDSGGRPDVTLFANEAAYFLPAPDFVFAEFPHRIKMPRDATSTVRTRLTLLSEGGPAERAALLLARTGYATMRRHLELLADVQPESEALLRCAVTDLKPEDSRAFLEQRLADRPVRVEWHRYYQQFAEYRLPDLDLPAKYRALLAAAPGDGALMYLLARVETDRAEARALYERALTASPPCYYAYNGLGAAALNEADFPRAIACFAAAEQKGLASETVRYNQRLARIAAGDFARLLAEARSRRQAAPADVAAAGEEITCSLLAGLGAGAAGEIKARFLQRLEKMGVTDPKERAGFDAYLSAIIAYGSGDAAAFAREISRLDTPAYAFQAAISRGDHAAAAAILSKDDEPASGAALLCYLAAQVAGDAAAAEAHFAAALQVMEHEDRDMRRLASLLRGPSLPELAVVNAIALPVDQKRIVLASLGWRDPARRADYFAWARRMNFDPDFPHLLIDRATAPAAALH